MIPSLRGTKDENEKKVQPITLRHAQCNFNNRLWLKTKFFDYTTMSSFEEVLPSKTEDGGRSGSVVE